jgi:hypothetical protein
MQTKTKKTRMYYHILEHCGYGKIGHQGYELTLAEAEAQVKKLSDFFPKSYFEIFADTSKKEPPITTI